MTEDTGKTDLHDAAVPVFGITTNTDPELPVEVGAAGPYVAAAVQEKAVATPGGDIGNIRENSAISFCDFYRGVAIREVDKLPKPGLDCCPNWPLLLYPQA